MPLGIRLAAIFLTLCLGAGCGEALCETGEEASCLLPTPCAALTAGACSGFARIDILSGTDPVPVGDDALASPGDFILQNDRVTIVIDGLGHPHHYAATGGAIIDAVAEGGRDGLAQIAQSVSFAGSEEDSVLYDRYRIVDTGAGAALQLRGQLAANADAKVLTRYEVHPCEAGVRVRTEIYNRSAEDAEWQLGDLFVLGPDGHRPFGPGPGFEHGESSEDASLPAELPFVATAPPAGAPRAAYGCVPCGEPALFGFLRGDVSFLGTPPTTIAPGNRAVFERFIIIAAGDDAASAADVAYAARAQLFGERHRRVTGRVTFEDGAEGFDENVVTILVEEIGDSRGGAATPHTQVTPARDGTFEAETPANAELEVVVLSFGREVARRAVPTEGPGTEGDAVVDIGTISIAAAATLRLTGTVDAAPTQILATIIPGDDETRDAVRARHLAGPRECAPLLGSPSAGDVACNRVMVDGETVVRVPAGSYRVVGTHGPFATMATATVTLAAGETVDVPLAISALPALADGRVSVDLHAHGPASYDAHASADAQGRAALAGDVQILGLTDHDVLAAYDDVVAALGAEDRLEIVTGLETTGQLPVSVGEGSRISSAGRLAFLPLTPVPSGPWRGAPADEGVEPGVIITRVSSSGFDPEAGLVQLLHPFGQPSLGRDVGFLRAIGIDATRLLSSESLATRTPPGSLFANDGYHTIELSNGAEPEAYLAQRSLYFYLLSQNVVRAATFGSDSHGLGGAAVGAARTVVTATGLTEVLGAIRTGRGLPTNGPLIEVTTTDGEGASHTPSLDPITPGDNPTLDLRIAAAPFIPIEEVRIIVNGRVIETLSDELSIPPDAFGAEGAVRFEGTVPIGEALSSIEFGDAFVVIEAGARLPAGADLDCDGIPETGDNDGNGVIDELDVGLRAGPSTPAPPVADMSSVCLAIAGPLRRDVAPADPDDPRHLFDQAIGAPPLATTNPLLFDLDGDGYGGAETGLTR